MTPESMKVWATPSVIQLRYKSSSTEEPDLYSVSINLSASHSLIVHHWSLSQCPVSKNNNSQGKHCSSNAIIHHVHGSQKPQQYPQKTDTLACAHAYAHAHTWHTLCPISNSPSPFFSYLYFTFYFVQWKPVNRVILSWTSSRMNNTTWAPQVKANVQWFFLKLFFFLPFCSSFFIMLWIPPTNIYVLLDG